MALDDPEIQQGLLTTLLASCGGLLYWFKRRLTLADKMYEKISEIDKDLEKKVDKEHFDQQLERMYDKIEQTHKKIDKLGWRNDGS